MHIDREPILITGAARSGTSLCAGVVHICGAWGGKLAGATKYNRKGMFENSTIRNEVVKPYLREIGCDPLGQDPLPNIDLIKDACVLLTAKWRNKVIDIMKGQGYPGGPWFYKGAKMCLMWPLWHTAFPQAQWIIVRRDSEDIVTSCLKTSFMRAFRTRSGWLQWVAEHEKRFEEMYDAKLKIQEVWPQRAINGDLTQMQMVINNLGLDWKFDKVKEFVEPSLWHKAKKERTHGN